MVLINVTNTRRTHDVLVHFAFFLMLSTSFRSSFSIKKWFSCYRSCEEIQKLWAEVFHFVTVIHKVRQSHCICILCNTQNITPIAWSSAHGALREKY